ncbi:beta-galactosidase trimerization domain-containing protein [Gemmobacter lanyuensis]
MIQPQGRDFRYEELVFRWYEAFRRLGLNVDVVAPGAPLLGYALVVVPTMLQVSEPAQKALAEAEGLVLIGPRAGSRDRHFAIPQGLPPGPLAALTGTRVTQVASLRPGLSQG